MRNVSARVYSGPANADWFSPWIYVGNMGAASLIAGVTPDEVNPPAGTIRFEVSNEAPVGGVNMPFEPQLTADFCVLSVHSNNPTPRPLTLSVDGGGLFTTGAFGICHQWVRVIFSLGDGGTLTSSQMFVDFAAQGA